MAVMRLPDRAGYHRVRTPHVTEADAAQLVAACCATCAQPLHVVPTMVDRGGGPMIADRLPPSTTATRSSWCAWPASPASGAGGPWWRATGGCADPIHLVGQSTMIDAATGEVLNRYDTEDEPNRRLLVACRNRRASRCAPCAEVYRADTYQLIRAGLAGGKSVPDTRGRPPPGLRHPDRPQLRRRPPPGRQPGRHGAALPSRRRLQPTPPRRRPLPGPGRRPRHATTTPGRSSGTPWPACCGIAPPPSSSATWPDSSASPKSEFRRQARVSYGKVAEFQARGLVHFHVIIRLDGPDGPDQPPPEGLTVEVLTAAIEAAARQAVVTSPDTPATGGHAPGALGRAARHPTHHRRRTPAKANSPTRKWPATWRKYATKAAETTGTLDRPVVCWRCKGTGHDPEGTGLCKGCHGRATRHDDVHHLVDNPHAQAMISACWTLGARPELEQLCACGPGRTCSASAGTTPPGLAATPPP